MTIILALVTVKLDVNEITIKCYGVSIRSINHCWSPFIFHADANQTKPTAAGADQKEAFLGVISKTDLFQFTSQQEDGMHGWNPRWTCWTQQWQKATNKERKTNE